MTGVAVTGNLLDGRIVTAQAVLAVWDPADLGRQVGAVPELGADDVGVVYDVAARAAQTWAATGPIARGAILLAAAAAIRSEGPRLARLIVDEMGKTIAEATGEVGKAAEFFEYYGSFGRQPTGELLADARANTSVMVRREPLGVVLLITPWNDPLLTPARKMAPALIAGNAVVLKPASHTPLIALELAAILNDAGLPPGVLGTVTGRGSAIGDALLTHPALAAVSFTGSTEVGLAVQRQLAGRQVRVQTEMGGKNATVVLADADLALAADCIVAAAFGQSGQRCTATSRLVVVEPVADELISAIASRVGSIVIGAGSAASTTMGPLVSASHRDEVERSVRDAVTAGARVLAGGAPVPPALADGAFTAPVVLSVSRDAEIWRRELFGPVLSVLIVSDEDEAVEAANDSVYGLSASVFTGSLAAAHRCMAAIDAGQIAINQPTSGWDVHHPFGGFGDSGSPFKEQGREALAFYTKVKTIAVRFA